MLFTEHEQKRGVISELLTVGYEQALQQIQTRISNEDYYRISDCTFQNLYEILIEERKKTSTNRSVNTSILQPNDQITYREKRRTDLRQLEQVRQKDYKGMLDEQENILPSRGDYSTSCGQQSQKHSRMKSIFGLELQQE